MPQTKAAKKQVRASKPRQIRNKAVRSLCKSRVAKAEKMIVGGETDASQAAITEAVSALDKAVAKGVIHANNAARRKSRLVKKYNQEQAPAPEAPQADA